MRQANACIINNLLSTGNKDSEIRMEVKFMKMHFEIPGAKIWLFVVIFIYGLVYGISVLEISHCLSTYLRAGM